MRKSFLVRPGDDTKPDSGWLLKASIGEASEPNVFGDASVFGVFPGSHSEGDLVHFVVTQDHLEMLNLREVIAADKQTTGRSGEIVNAWPVTNVDLKYRVNLDGEKTNFYEENQELDWDKRQWIKLNFSKNDLSDLAPLGSFYASNVARCADIANSSTTLIPDSFHVDYDHGYIEWTVQETLPIKWSDPSCVEAFGAPGQMAARLGRDNVTLTLKYSLVRANPNPTAESAPGAGDGYHPMILAEKDPIRRKYGAFTFASIGRDTDTGLPSANEYAIRFNPAKPIVFYFEQGFPANFKSVFTKNLPGTTPLPNGGITIEDATNALFQNAQVKARVVFKEWNAPDDAATGDDVGKPVERKFGDARYSFIRFLPTYDSGSSFIGIGGWTRDPRTGEKISADIVLNNIPIKDVLVVRLDAFLKSLGASEDLLSPDEWNPDPGTACTPGATVPIVQAAVASRHNSSSTLFAKMQQYLYQPADQTNPKTGAPYGPLGPQDFIAPHNNPDGSKDEDFYRAYFAYLPYLVYGDPELNQFTRPSGSDVNYGGAAVASQLWDMIGKEREFHDLAATIDKGLNPFDLQAKSGALDAIAFNDRMKRMAINHRELRYLKQGLAFRSGVANHGAAVADNVTDFAIESVIGRDARHCVDSGDGKGLHWETKKEWTDNLIQSFWSQVFWHEFGHALGLTHNFMGSVDRNNFPVLKNPDGSPAKNSDGTTRYGLYSNSVMEYNAPADRAFWQAGWGPYDQGAISWLYANASGNQNPVPAGASAKGISGQVSATAPWNDPKGFDADGNEIQFLYCNETHTRLTPLCRANDLGTTPSEITANEIENYEWQYTWRNFRRYHKIWDLTNYADIPLNFVTEQRRFLSLWAFDMSSSEVTQNLQRIGFQPPAGTKSQQLYFAALTDKFDDEMSKAASLSAVFHEAIIQQSSGQRPYRTVFDNFFGDVTQQGIALDKLFALQSFTALWPVDNYDQNQAAGTYIASYAPFGLSSQQNGTAIGSFYQTVAEQAIDSMTASPYDSFAYFRPLGVSQFAMDTHSVDFIKSTPANGTARTEVRDWVGGFVFPREADFLAFFRRRAIDNNFVDPPINVDCRGATIDTCNYDPRVPRAYQQDVHLSDILNEFLGPDGRRYAWAYLQDRNVWVVVDRDRNSATYTVVRQYNDDVNRQKDDGNYGGAAYDDENQIKYFLDYFVYANNTPH